MPAEKPSPNGDKYHTPAGPVKKYILLSLFCMAQFLDAFNISALFSAIPVMSAELGLSASESVWLTSAYQLTFASFLLCSGRISDVYNPKWAFVAGAAWLGVFSIIGGFMKSSIPLLVMRALSGIPAALTIPSALTLLVRLFPGTRERARAISVFSGSGALGNVLGLIVGALFVEYANWRWVFYLAGIISIPIAVICALVVPKQPISEEILAQRKLKNLDLPGIAILTSGILLLIFALTSSGTEGWKSPMVLAPLVIGIILIALFFVWEAKADPAHAAFPPSTWRYQNVAVLLGVALSIFLWFVNVFLVKVTLWQDTYKWSAIKSAIRFLPIGLVAGPITLFAEPICNRFESKWVLLTALVLLATSSGMFPFADKDTDRSYLTLDLPASIIGAAGGALLFVTTNLAIFLNTPDEISGTIASILNSFLQLGSAVGSAVVTSLMSGVAEKAGPNDEYAGRAAAFWLLFAIMVIEFFAVLFFYRTNEQAARDAANAIDPESASGRPSLANKERYRDEKKEPLSAQERLQSGMPEQPLSDSSTACATTVATAAPTPIGPLSKAPSIKAHDIDDVPA
ncbi:MFS general substrate transporter [Auriculariales sp. MPI-PUGE-AT-0066]|nr:MFS general substrate transporter [Auriculariales sp. MPI-PUGE-AT-0066]